MKDNVFLLNLSFVIFTKYIYWFTGIPQGPPSSSSYSVSSSFLVYNLCSLDYGPSQFSFFFYEVDDWWFSLSLSSLMSPFIFPRYSKHQLFWLQILTLNWVLLLFPVNFCFQFFFACNITSIQSVLQKKKLLICQRFRVRFFFFLKIWIYSARKH